MLAMGNYLNLVKKTNKKNQSVLYHQQKYLTDTWLPLSAWHSSKHFNLYNKTEISTSISILQIWKLRQVK